MNAGAISRTGAGGIASSDVVARLVERGVVEQVRLQHGGTPRYMLTPRFAAVRNALVSALPDCALAAAERQAYRLQ